MNVSKAKLEGLFVDELRWLQPTPGYLRVLKERVMTIWYERKAAANRDKSEVERRVATLQQRLDRLEEAFIIIQSIDHASYERQRDKLRQELALENIDLHTAETDQLDGLAPVDSQMKVWWAHQDSNLGLAGYEPAALTAELWAPGERGKR